MPHAHIFWLRISMAGDAVVCFSERAIASRKNPILCMLSDKKRCSQVVQTPDSCPNAPLDGCRYQIRGVTHKTQSSTHAAEATDLHKKPWDGLQFPLLKNNL